MEENTLTGQPGEVRMTIHVTRKATGKVETFELTGTPVAIEATEENPATELKDS